MNLPGGPLLESDLRRLAACGITADLARQALLRRVDSSEGAALVGRNGSGDYSGLAYPYIWPGDEHVREYRLRRDNPNLEPKPDGGFREKDKYLSPPGRGNMLYFVPGTEAAWLDDVSLPIVVTEGEKKCLALWELAQHNLGDAAEKPKFMPVSLPGVWNWRGTIGKAPGPRGDRRDVKGPIPDLARIAWKGRRVTIVFDTNAKTNESVQRARTLLAKELRRRGAEVFLVNLPDLDGVNGVDDLLARWGPDRVSELLEQTEPVGGPNLLCQLFNDHGNAERLIALHGDDLRYCYPFRKWLVWDGLRWAVDDGGRAEKLAKQTALELVSQAVRTGNKDAEKFGKQTLDDRRVSTMLSSAHCELPISPESLDVHLHLLNFHNGTVDLKTGVLSAHRREDFITKLIHFDYRPHAECPLFLQFLAQIMGSHPDVSEDESARVNRLIGYLQKALGYSLTGNTSEKAVFLCYGSGNNGKTTLLSLFRDLLPEYSVLLQIDTLMVRQENTNTQADLADLRGARFVMTSETEEGQRLAEGKLKRITQGMGRIKAVRKYENPVEFNESHKLWMDCNHRPIVRGTDAAIWNRLHLIPFTVTIADDQIDRDIRSKLLAEAEGILAWAVAGAILWYKDGLGRPLEVAEAVQDYRDEMDQLGRFVGEYCVTGEFAQVKARQLYQAYKKWSEDGGEHPITEAAFSRRMAERGFEKQHTEHGKVYFKIGLRVPDEGADGKKSDGKADG